MTKEQMVETIISILNNHAVGLGCNIKCYSQNQQCENCEFTANAIANELLAEIEQENMRLLNERNDAIQLANHLQNDYSKAFKRMQDMQVEIDALKAKLKEAKDDEKKDI